MNLHEFQAKQIFRDLELPVSKGEAAASVAEAVKIAHTLGGDKWVCKVQVHAGGRGKAGGVKLCNSIEQVEDFCRQWIGERIVTHQTDERGQIVRYTYVEEACEIERELYLGVVIDRSAGCLTLMASTEGGVEIEKVAEETPEKILRSHIDNTIGPQPYAGRAMAFELGLEGNQVHQFASIFCNVARLFQKYDCNMVEVNPLVVTSQGDLHCLDAKIDLDSNALFRHPELESLRDASQEDERESRAAEFGLSYVALDGNIGCMVNGAGLAMGTMDLVKLYGGNPANFLDVGGGVNKEAVAEAFKIILEDPEVKAVLINIFGGIVSCAIIAEGIVAAFQEVGVSVPVVVRFDGNSAEEGRNVLEASGLNIIAASTLQDAASKAVAAAGAY